MVPGFFFAIALTEVVCLTTCLVGLILTLAYKHLANGLTVAAGGFGAALFGLGVLLAFLLFGSSSSFSLFDAWVVFNLFRVICFGVVVVGFCLAVQEVAARLSGRSERSDAGGGPTLPDPVLLSGEKLAHWHAVRDHENGVQR